MFSLVSTSTVGSTKYPLSPCRPPPATALAPSERPDSRKPQTRLSCSSETRGPISLDSSHPGPTLIFFAFADTPSTTSSKMLFSTYRREPAQQHCPWLKKMALLSLIHISEPTRLL